MGEELLSERREKFIWEVVFELGLEEPVLELVRWGGGINKGGSPGLCGDVGEEGHFWCQKSFTWEVVT